MTLLNRSFEVPDGTAPTLTSGSSEPFVLAHGLPIDFRTLSPGGIDIVERYTVNAADFADVTAATAAELGAAMNGSLTQFFATDVGGNIVVASLYAGAASSIQVVSSGGVQSVLNFPAGPVFGTTYPGPPQSWTITSAASFWEWAGFASFTFGTPAEGFEQDWGQAAVSFGPAIPFSESFETGWAAVVVGGAQAAGTFDGGASQVEDFENLWNAYSPALPFTLFPASFAGPVTAETFDHSWNIVSPAPNFQSALFDLGLESEEDFEETTTGTHAVLVGTDPPDGLYRVLINGTPYSVNAVGLSATGVKNALRDAINANTQMVSVLDSTGAQFAYMVLAPTNPPAPGVVFTVRVEGPTGAPISVVLATQFTLIGNLWVGQDHNFTL